MLDRNALLEYAGELTIYQVEKDYLQHLILSRIYAGDCRLAFKGGTALQKAYGINRFSEDLDFAIMDKDNTFLSKIEKAVKSVNNFYNSTYEIEQKDMSIDIYMKIEGPLYVKPQSIQTIVIEISKREKLSMAPETMLITPIYRDISPYFAEVMTLDEILAEKVRAIITRKRLRPRDLYDMYFILHKGGKFRKEIVKNKLIIYKIKFSKEALIRKINEMKNLWDKELSILMKKVPNYEEIKEYVIDEIKKQLQ